MVTDFSFAPCDMNKISATVVTNLMITHVNFGRFNQIKPFLKLILSNLHWTNTSQEPNDEQSSQEGKSKFYEFKLEES